MLPRAMTCLLVAAVVSLCAPDSLPAKTDTAAATDSLQLCDRDYETGDVGASARVARDLLARDPDSAAAAWRLSRALIAAGNLEADTERRRAIFREGLVRAETAVRLDPAGTYGHTCAAICLGTLSGLAGGRVKIELAERARAAARRAVELDDTNHLAWLVLGVWNREVAMVGGLKKAAAGLFYGGVPQGASLAASDSCLQRAIALAPQFVNPHRERGITLMAMHRYAEAATAFETAAGLAPRAPADSIYVEDARRRLAQARKRLTGPPDAGLR